VRLFARNVHIMHAMPDCSRVKHVVTRCASECAEWLVDRKARVGRAVGWNRAASASGGKENPASWLATRGLWTREGIRRGRGVQFARSQPSDQPVL
jgi:hypothetical protein